MRGISEDGRALEDALGDRYPFRPLLVKLADTIARTIGLTALLYAIALIWEAFH